MPGVSKSMYCCPKSNVVCHLLLTVVMLSMLTGKLYAQAHRAVTLADSLNVTTTVYRDLFHGDSLTTSEQVQAKVLILDALRRMLTRPDTEPCVNFELAKKIMADRDSALLTLLHSASDSATFRIRAAPDSPHGACPYRN
jgi:hypothetical protein